ncbi:hypothetical protein Acr_23g0001090 [Actinidia rufa]|uniref:LsmAD domain-containing protein n=1 Tax=Actinidia rufa TaxID=165716 RepID=A0A7J0GM21_9ERIC|nr:hypothetical protein Acr_23g0001090 [Actinidia rufa]
MDMAVGGLKEKVGVGRIISYNLENQTLSKPTNAGVLDGSKAAEYERIILKMARLLRTGSSWGQKSTLFSVSKAPSGALIIPAEDLVQITAKDVSVTRDGSTSDLQRVKQQDIMLDSSISQSSHVDMERVLERWVPDEDDSQCPELENIFDGPWNRGWDQFEANETLFGVKSTFDEELYTTKLERGPKMRELEREALRIAREIQVEETLDLHLAEERGFQLHENFDIDEETRFSSVFRGVDDTGYDENNNDEVQPSLPSTARDLQRSNSSDHSASEFLAKSSALDSESSILNLRIQENQFSEHVENNYIKEFVEEQMLAEEEQTLKSEGDFLFCPDLQSSLMAKKDGPSIRKLSPNATSYDPTSLGSSKCLEKMSLPSELSADVTPVKTHGASQPATSRGRPSSSASSASEFGAVAAAYSCPGLSPSSSMGSFSSEKSALNPHAKEFKLNPNAKSFIPSQTPLRPASPVSDGSFYFPAVPHMHGMPVGVGVGPSFVHQPVMFNPQVAPMQSPQAYFHPNGPQYGQQMILGHPRQVLYMPTYTPLYKDVTPTFYRKLEQATTFLPLLCL